MTLTRANVIITGTGFFFISVEPRMYRQLRPLPSPPSSPQQLQPSALHISCSSNGSRDACSPAWNDTEQLLAVVCKEKKQQAKMEPKFNANCSWMRGTGVERVQSRANRINKSNKPGLAVEGSKLRRGWREAELKYAAQVDPALCC